MIFERANELREKINFKKDIDGYEICVSVRHNFEPNWKENLKIEKGIMRMKFIMLRFAVSNDNTKFYARTWSIPNIPMEEITEENFNKIIEEFFERKAYLPENEGIRKEMNICKWNICA